jgi:hypothetical protein
VLKSSLPEKESISIDLRRILSGSLKLCGPIMFESIACKVNLCCRNLRLIQRCIYIYYYQYTGRNWGGREGGNLRKAVVVDIDRDKLNQGVVIKITFQAILYFWLIL